MQIAQVHRATLVDGREVVVKVQHQGIKKIILEVLHVFGCLMQSKTCSFYMIIDNAIFLQDLKNAKSIVDWIAWAEPQYDFNPMIDEWCKEAPKELDFDNEAGMISSYMLFLEIFFHIFVMETKSCFYFYFTFFFYCDYFELSFEDGLDRQLGSLVKFEMTGLKFLRKFYYADVCFNFQ